MLDTQKDAYIETRSKASSDRDKIIHHARTLDFGFTTQEMAILLSMEYYEAQTRISELVTADRLKDTGLRRLDRKRNGAVWEFNPNPQPQDKIPKGKGDKDKWEAFVLAVRAREEHKCAHTVVKAQQLSIAWAEAWNGR